MTHHISTGMTIIGADGVTVGTVERTDDRHIILEPPMAGAHKGHTHLISRGLVAGVDGDVVRLSANADVAVTFEEEA